MRRIHLQLAQIYLRQGKSIESLHQSMMSLRAIPRPVAIGLAVGLLLALCIALVIVIVIIRRYLAPDGPKSNRSCRHAESNAPSQINVAADLFPARMECPFFAPYPPELHIAKSFAE